MRQVMNTIKLRCEFPECNEIVTYENFSDHATECQFNPNARVCTIIFSHTFFVDIVQINYNPCIYERFRSCICERIRYFSSNFRAVVVQISKNKTPKMA